MQNNVSVSTKESDLKIKYGMINYGEERELARTSVKYILTDVNDIRQNYIRLGFHLREFDKMGYYTDFGYSSFLEFCDANLGLNRSVVSRCIAVFDAFAMRDERGVYKMWLKEKYSQFSYSQLCEMVSMKEGQRNLVKPEMTIKQIRELKKKNVSQKNDNVSQVATSQQGKKLDIKKYLHTFGAARKSMIKNADCIKRITLTIYDKEGNAFNGCIASMCDVLSTNTDNVIIRLNVEL